MLQHANSTLQQLSKLEYFRTKHSIEKQQRLTKTKFDSSPKTPFYPLTQSQQQKQFMGRIKPAKNGIPQSSQNNGKVGVNNHVDNSLHQDQVFANLEKSAQATLKSSSMRSTGGKAFGFTRSKTDTGPGAIGVG